MSTLLLKFIIQNNSPLFHRWLPDGEQDAIVLPSADPGAILKVWFERRGFVDDSGFIRFSWPRREVDPEIMSRQGILTAGHLLGLLELKNLTDQESVALRDNKIGDSHYVALGKRIVKKLVYPTVARFLNILSTNYGQYWIGPLKEWDSRKESLGHYCSYTLNLKWSLDGGVTWSEFQPDRDHPPIVFEMGEGFEEYLTKKDWEELRKIVQTEYNPSLVSSVLSCAHQFLDQGNLRYALIEGVSALEIALHEFFRQKLVTDAKSLLNLLSPFWEQSLSQQIIVVATAIGTIPLENIKHTVAAIDMRNKVIHEGWNLHQDKKEIIAGMLNTVVVLLSASFSGPKFKFPPDTGSNAIRSPEVWESHYSRSTSDD
jgi:hypothetical protein